MDEAVLRETTERLRERRIELLHERLEMLYQYRHQLGQRIASVEQTLKRLGAFGPAQASTPNR